MAGYPRPDEDVGQEFLDDLRRSLDAAGDYGTDAWRRVRNDQMNRLRAYGWAVQDLADHYHTSRAVVRRCLARAQDQPELLHRIVNFRGSAADVAAVRALLDDRDVPHTITTEEIS